VVGSLTLRRTLLIAVLVVLAGASAVGIWFLWRRPSPSPTAGAWPAVVSSLAGKGTPGFQDGPLARSSFADPFGIVVAADGTVYVTDGGDNNAIRKVSASHVETVAGGTAEDLVDGPGSRAAFHTPSGIAARPDGSLYVADTGNHAIRRIAPDGRVSTIAGAGRPGFADGRGGDALFDGPIGIAIGRDGSLYVTDTYNDRIRKIDANGAVTTIAGSGVPGSLDWVGPLAEFDTPTGIAVVSDETLAVADTGSHAVRRIDLKTGVVTTIVPLARDGSDVSLFKPIGLAADERGSLYVTDARGRILQIFPDGSARTLAGSSPGFRDGLGSAARFFGPTGIAVDREGALLVADPGNYMVRRIAPPGLYVPDPPRSPLASLPGIPIHELAGPPLPWPIEPQFEWHEVAGTMGEPRGNSGGDGRDRFHAGVDVRADQGTVVRAVRRGKVDSPVAAQGVDSLNESLAISPFTYVHLRVGRDRQNRLLAAEPFVPVLDAAGQMVRVRIRRGTRVELGDPLGTVNRFSHVHLNAGGTGREINPLLLRLPGFRDTVPPSIAPRGIQLIDERGEPFSTRSRGRLVVSGRVRIVVDAWDRADGNKPARRLGVFRLGYQVIDDKGKAAPGFDAPRITMVFDRLPQGPDAARLVYAEGSGITAYGNRRTRYLYVLTNHVRDGAAVEGFWDTDALAAGNYTLRVLVEDTAGNAAIKGRDLPVVVVPAAAIPSATLAAGAARQ
jgi:sugar lactone lactonase YvrE